MTIREERAAEFPAIYALVEEAFKTAKVADGDEQNFVDQLRAGEGYIPELSLVAEEGGELIGHIMLTRAAVEGPGGSRTTALLLAPVSVVLAHRNRGVGSALILDAFRRAREMGYHSVFLIGDPAYYGRFGFRPGANFGIRYHIESIPPQYFLAFELTPGALAGTTGVFIDDYTPPES